MMKLKYAFTEDGAAIVALPEPIQCTCGKMVMIVVNRLGKTRCVECDFKFKESLEAK